MSDQKNGLGLPDYVVECFEFRSEGLHIFNQEKEESSLQRQH